jgi:manganese/zinc/iron transport system permease protein
LGLLSLSCIILFWNQFKLLSFDPEYGNSLGLPMAILDILLTGLLVIAIVIGLQTVGVVLMSAMVVAPAAAARQWTDRMGIMITLAAAFGAAAGIAGAVISSTTAGIPTGPTIVLCISGVVLISMALAPNRGLVWAQVREVRNRRKLQLDAVLCDLHQLALQHGDPDHGHEMAALDAMSASGGRGAALTSLIELEKRGLAKQTDRGEWTITARGTEQAEKIRESLGAGWQ